MKTNNTMKSPGIVFLLALLAAGCGSSNNSTSPLAVGGNGVTLDQAADGSIANTTAALDINDDLEVVGYMELAAGQPFRAAFWTIGGDIVTPRALNPIADNTFSAAFALDDAGKAVGQSANGSRLVAVYWPVGASTPVPLPPLDADGNSVAFGISPDGSCIVGEARNAAQTTRAVIWIADGNGDFTAAPVVLPVSLVGSAFSSANGVARSGAQIWVAGTAEDGSGVSHATLWRSTNSGGVFVATDLRTAGESGSSALSVNTAGDVVGESETSDGVFAAATWRSASSYGRTILAANGVAMATNNGGKAVGTSAGKGTAWDTAAQNFTATTLFDTASQAYGLNDGDASGYYVVGVNNGKGFVKKVN